MELSITVIIVAVTTLVSLLAEANQQIKQQLIFYPPAISRNHQWYRFITCGLIHGDFGHLFFNMLSMYLFGRFVEEGFNGLFGDQGKWMYLFLYVSALFVSLMPTYTKHKDDPHYMSLGASGAVSAIVFAGLMLVPTLGIYLFFIPIPIPGFIFAPLYLLFSFMMERKGGDNINHSAHIWGALYGVLFMVIASKSVDYPLLQNMVHEIGEYIRSKGWL
ncbi:rhomboid family intramembrane serine protease [Paraflavisolibacter sp. H34]|uniref:rhomboid family intramembrane serine protease n=1 Tax=Huijunlia imazamoxiresistens TaxID=3127457 RepID=UPI00301B08C8